jgi:hypothetical protein
MDTIAYYLRYVAIYLMFGLTMALSSVEKITGSAPEWFTGQFQETLVASFPGLEVSWRLAGLLEVAVAVLIIASLVRLEFKPENPKPWLKASLGVAAITFMMLGVGQRISSEFGGAASLFFYFGATMATLLVVFHDEHKAVRHHSSPESTATAPA